MRRTATGLLVASALAGSCSGEAEPDGATPAVDAGTPAADAPADPDAPPAVERSPLDVSILYPITEGAASLAELPPVEADGHVLLEFEPFEAVAFDFSEGTPTETSFASLRWVSMRLDPCGRAATCAPLRLVFQPESGFDAAIHAFYDLGPDELRELADDIARLRHRHAPGLEVAEDWSVHPGLEAGTPYRDELVSLVRDRVSADRLQRIAAFAFPGSFPDPDGNQRWTFRLAERAGDSWALQPIRAGAEATTQTFDTNAFIEPDSRAVREVSVESEAACEVGYASSPEGVMTPGGALALGPACADEAEATELIDRARIVLDPSRTAVEDTDCASCHLAPVAARTLAERFPGAAGDAIAPAELGPPTAGIMRAFGYHEREDALIPVVSPRVRHETRASLDALSRRGER